MKVKSDVLKIQTDVRDAAGNKVEPEERPVARVISGVAPVEMSRTGKPVGGLKTEVILDAGSVSDFACGIRRLCKDCKYFNQKDWKDAVERIERSSDLVKRQEINCVRAALLMTKNAQLSASFEDQEGDLDVESALMAIGVCDALTDLADELYIVFPQGCCPDSIVKPDGTEIPIVTSQRPDGCFQPVNRTVKKEQNKAYDLLMRAAQGKLE